MGMKYVLFCCAISAFGAEAPNSDRHFSQPAAVDSLLEAHPIALPVVKPADLQNALSPVPQPVNKDTAVSPANGAVFHIQVDALSDLDAAQARKAVLEQTLGEKIEVIFDAPYYKLRLGNFTTKQEADERLLELVEKNIPGFIVRQ